MTMPDELLYLVDSEDNEVGKIWKSEAHRDPSKLHREVGVFIYDDAGRLLLQRRGYDKSMYPGHWQAAAAGHVPYGDTYEQAAHMELSEEIGFDVPLRQFDKIVLEDPSERRFMALFIGRYEGAPVRPQQSEVAEARFFSEQEYLAMKQSGDKIVPKSAELIERFWAEEAGSLMHAQD
ncbi:MAG: NUDIX domain-containing protein [bacterium]|nr:NUDIX domain-containing protein [bacterium]